jgi:hypothetical protein
MLFGHNTNVKLGGAVLHVQTEDCGNSQALIDTTVYYHGRVLHRRTNNYLDLLPLDSKREGILRNRIDDQHYAVVEELRTGILQLALPAVPAYRASATKKDSGNSHEPDSPSLAVALTNAKSWLAGKRANLQVAVWHKENGKGVANVPVAVRIDGAAEAAEFSSKSDSNGHARFEFDMPKLSGTDPALVIEATEGHSKAHLRFQLRPKPRVSVV